MLMLKCLIEENIKSNKYLMHIFKAAFSSLWLRYDKVRYSAQHMSHNIAIFDMGMVILVDVPCVFVPQLVVYVALYLEVLPSREFI